MTALSWFQWSFLKTSDEQSLDKRHGVLIRGCPQGFKCYVSFWLHACVRDTTGKSLCHKDWCALLLMRMASAQVEPVAHILHTLWQPRVPLRCAGAFTAGSKSLMLTSAPSCWKKKRKKKKKLSGMLPVPGWSNTARNVRLSMGICVRPRARAGRKIPGHTHTHARARTHGHDSITNSFMIIFSL